MKNIIINICFISILLLIFISNINRLKIEYNKDIIINDYINNKESNKSIYGYIQIDKINLKEILYDINSSDNSLSKGLFIKRERPLTILGHSGHGKLALFNNLDKLHIGDNINVNVNNKNFNYKIIDIFIKDKNEKIVNYGDLILVTCSKKDMSKKLEFVAKKV